MKKNGILKMIFTLMFSLLTVMGLDAQAMGDYECSHTGTVVDYTGLDECGFVIELDNGDILEPVDFYPNTVIYDSMRVNVGYEPLLDVGSICMVGIPAEILCFEEIVDTIECMAIFECSEVYFLDKDLDVEPDFAPYPYTVYQFSDKSIGNVITREWTMNDSVFSSDADPILEFKYPGIYEICLSIETEKGCTSIACLMINTDTIGDCKADFWYYPLDGPLWYLEDSVILDGQSMSVLPSDSILSYGLTYQFYDASYANGIDSWKWSFGDGEESEEQNPVHTFPGPGAYTVCLDIGSSSTGCSDTYCQTLIIDTISGNCKANFISCTYTFISDSVFEGDTLYIDSMPVSRESFVVGFKNLSTPEDAYYSWDFGDGQYSNDKNPIHKYNWPGSYYVCLSVYSEWGCYDTYCQYVNVGFDECDVEFTYDIAVPDCQGFQVAHAFMAPPTDDITWYSWDFGDGYYSWESNPFHIFENYGTYEVCLEVGFWNGCIARSCQSIKVAQNIINRAFEKSCGLSPVRNLEDNEPLSLENLYPLPARDELNFVINSDVNQAAKIEVYGLDGRKYNLGTVLNLIEGKNSIVLPLDGIATGMYIYKVITDEATIEGQFTVVR